MFGRWLIDTYENINPVKICFVITDHFAVARWLCCARAGSVPTFETSRSRERSSGHGSSSTADRGRNRRRSRSRFCVDWRFLGLARSLGVGTWPLGASTASGSCLGGASLCLPRGKTRLDSRELAITHLQTARSSGTGLLLGFAVGDGFGEPQNFIQKFSGALFVNGIIGSPILLEAVMDA